MEDLRERIWRLSGLDRVALINALIEIDAREEAKAHGAGARAKRGSVQRNRAEEARDNCDRLGKVIYFVRMRTLASGTSAGDEVLCRKLAEKLQTKDQWDGVFEG